MRRLRTPTDCFDGLPDFDFETEHAEVRDPTGDEPLRMGYLDEGDPEGDAVVLLHGEPSWSYLYRFVIPDLVGAGHRVVAPDLIGFGKSDKPTDRAEYTYARHVEWTRELLFEQLGLSGVTLFGQDWGSLIGLRLVAEHPGRFARVAIGNGGLPTGDGKMSDAFFAWRRFSQDSPEFPIGNVVSLGCNSRLSPDVVAAYDAPFPDESYKAGARQFPMLVPTSHEDPAHHANVTAWAVLSQWTKPFLCCFSDGDAVSRGADRRFLELVPGAQGRNHVTIEGAGHFLQEERGPVLAAVLNDFIAEG